MAENHEIEAVANILRTHGDTFTGGRPVEIAMEWLSYDFTVEEVSAWCEVGCWDAFTADTWQTYGFSPAKARKACDDYDADNGGDLMYACCNNDACVEYVAAALEIC